MNYALKEMYYLVSLLSTNILPAVHSQIVYEFWLSDEIRCRAWREGTDQNFIAGRTPILSRLTWVP